MYHCFPFDVKQDVKSNTFCLNNDIDDDQDVPGTLLNMALLNLGSSDPNLRTAAYNLLCALTSTFDLKIEGHLLETNGLCIPSNNTIFIKVTILFKVLKSILKSY